MYERALEKCGKIIANIRWSPGDVILRELNQCTDAHCIKSLNYVHISTQIQKNAT